uniref:Rx N-terminal domain-containing protein n=1 Tax=Setaria italica TaxID=4555 RepID=K3Z1C2_SETIT
MEVLLSAVFGEVFTRYINFFINKSSKLQVLGMEDCLWRVLLRAQVIVDEAMGWHITNQAMLQELNVLRDAIHRGCYVSDNF